jgi:hypothetical protein
VFCADAIGVGMEIRADDDREGCEAGLEPRKICAFAANQSCDCCTSPPPPGPLAPLAPASNCHSENCGSQAKVRLVVVNPIRELFPRAVALCS